MERWEERKREEEHSFLSIFVSIFTATSTIDGRVCLNVTGQAFRASEIGKEYHKKVVVEMVENHLRFG